jgi:hypothetical protein
VVGVVVVVGIVLVIHANDMGDDPEYLINCLKLYFISGNQCRMILKSVRKLNIPNN